MAEFKYNREQFISAKAFVLTALNYVALANSTLSTLATKMDESYSSFGISNGIINGEPTRDTLDFSSISEKKNDFVNIYKLVDELNNRLDTIKSAISQSVDPELDDLIKQTEAAMIAGENGFLDIYKNQGLLDEMQLYELLKKNLDNPYLNLTDEQKTFADAIINHGNQRYEYEGMSWYEKAGQGAIVFSLSVVEGVGSIGEQIVDGAVIIGAGASSSVVGIFDANTAATMMDSARSYVATDYMGDLYDATCKQLGLNEIVATGPCHKVGNAVGEAAGEAAILMIPGGAAVHAVIGVAKGAGKYAQGVAGDESVSDTELMVGVAGNAAIGAVTETAKGAIKTEFTPSNPIAQVGVKTGVGYAGVNMGNTIATSALDYGMHTEDYEGIGDYVSKKNLPEKLWTDINKGMGSGVVGAYSAGVSAGVGAASTVDKVLKGAQGNKDYIKPVTGAVSDYVDKHHSTLLGSVDKAYDNLSQALGLSASAEEANPKTYKTAAEIAEEMEMDEVRKFEELTGRNQ